MHKNIKISYILFWLKSYTNWTIYVVFDVTFSENGEIISFLLKCKDKF